MHSGPANLRASAAAAAAALLLAGCGGEDSSAGSAQGTYPVEIVRAEFPTRQRLAERSTFEIVVRNAGDRTIPNLAVTLRGFGQRNDDAEPPRRSLWLIDVPPVGRETSSSETWTAGALAPAATATLRWVVTPIMAGSRTLAYELALALGSGGQARLSSGGAARGSIGVRVTGRPPKARVDPRTGKVI